jgi:hypothetical protein
MKVNTTKTTININRRMFSKIASFGILTSLAAPLFASARVRKSVVVSDACSTEQVASKKVLVLMGSPRKDGNTNHLCDEFIRGAKESGHDCEKIFLKDKKIGG